MAKKYMVVPIALLGANGAILNHGAVVTKEELTGSVETLLEEGFIVEHKESKADKDAAEAKAKEEADKDAAEQKAKDDQAEADRLAQEQADKDAAEAKAKEEADKDAAENKDVKDPLAKLKDNNKK